MPRRSAPGLPGAPPNPYEMLPRSDGSLAYQIIPTPGGMPIEKDVLVSLRDGVRLASNVFRPDKPGKFPVILAMTPYGKDQTPPGSTRTVLLFRPRILLMSIGFMRMAPISDT